MLTPIFIIRSGYISSGNVGHPHISSGAITSGQLGVGGNAPDGTNFLRDDFTWNAPTATVGSGAIGSGKIASGAVQGFFGTTRHIASGTVGVFDFGSGAVVAGSVGSGAIVSGNIASGSIGRFHVASGQFGGFELGSGSIVSGRVASGQIGFGHLANASVQSGTLASGVVSQFALSSGAVNSGQINTTGTPDGTQFLRDDFVWSQPTLTIGSGAVGSGKVASGTVQGFFGTTRNIASGTVGVFDFGSGAVIAGAVGSGAVVSGNIASGQIGTGHLADNSITSGDIASGVVSQFKLASGAVNSGHLNTTGTPDGTKFLRDDFSWAAAGGGLTSGSVGSGYLASGSVRGFFGTTRDIASGTVGVFDFGSGAVVAGSVGSGAIVSGNIASGQIGTFHLANNSITSGDIASGQIFTYHLSSGATITNAQFVASLVSGTAWNQITEEIISGVRAVALSASGTIRVAMAGSRTRMPAIGIVVDNVASGIAANVFAVGSFQFTSGLADYSGYVGQALYVGRSGQIVTGSGSFNSGGLASGDVYQQLGVPSNSGGISLLTQEALIEAFALSGNIGSGQVGQFHLASGAVNSGHVASGAVLGQAGGGAFTIASGTIGTFDIGSGAIISGRIASGQIGNFAISSGAVTSGRLGVGGNAPDGTNFLRDDFTWAAPTATVGSGAIGSGKIASGAVQGFFGTTPHIASGTVGVWDFGSGAVVAGTVGSGAVVSGNIASGQLGRFHIASGQLAGFELGSGSIVSGRIASGQIGTFHLASGILTSGFWIASGSVFGQAGPNQFCIASGTIGTFDIGSGAIQSGHIASGDIGRFHIASGQLAGFELGSGAIVSGRIASGQIGTFHLRSGIIQSGFWVGSGSIWGQAGVNQFCIASGTITTNDLGSGAIVSGLIASGQVGNFAISSGAVTSGRLGVTGTPDGTKLLRDDFTWVTPGAASITSGSVGPSAFASGGAIRYTAPLVSGLSFLTAITEEAISGLCAVQFSQSGNIRQAMASVSGRMPAVGVVIDNVASGIQTTVYTLGQFQPSSGLLNASGYISQLIYVGRSGQVVTNSGWFNSGGFASGDIIQPIGYVEQNLSGQNAPSTILVAATATLPFVASLVYSGNIASGQVGAMHIASGFLNSGTMIPQANQVEVGGLSSGFYAAGMNISGVRAVTLQSGAVVICQAYNGSTAGSGFMAIGVAVNNFLSGDQCIFVSWGDVAVPAAEIGSGAMISGGMGHILYLGTSGQIVDDIQGTPPGVNSSGTKNQRLGMVSASGRIFVAPVMTKTSGNVFTVSVM